VYALNFYSPLFIDQLRKGRKTATIRLGDKSHKYRKGQLVWVTVGHRHGPRQRIFTAIIDDVSVKPVRELTQREIERDNPEFASWRTPSTSSRTSTRARSRWTTRSP
jgi:hypothetical protein